MAAAGSHLLRLGPSCQPEDFILKTKADNDSKTKRRAKWQQNKTQSQMAAAGSHLLRLGPALWKFTLRANPQTATAPVSAAAGDRPGAWACTGFD